MAYHQLYYHLIWAVKHRQPLITPEVETAVYRHIRGKVDELGGVSFALNGVMDHVHLVAHVPPKIAVSEFIRQVKGVSSALYNRNRDKDAPALYWQNSYGAFTFGKKRIPYVIAYVERQKEHHRDKTLVAPLERIEESSSTKIVEQQTPYLADYANWLAEMGEEG